MPRCPAPPRPNRLPLIAAAAVVVGAAGVTADLSAQPIQSSGGAVGPGDSMAQVILWCGVLLLTAVVLAVAFFVIRKKLNAMDEPSPSAGNPLGFTLADLRQMHAEGQLSHEEFDFAKRKMLARTKAQLDGPPAEDEEPEFIDLGDGTAPPTPGPPDPPSPGAPSDLDSPDDPSPPDTPRG